MNKRNLLSWLLIAFTPIFLMGSSVVGVVSGEGKPLVHGGSTTSTTGGFGSRAQMIAAMQDSKYQSDPAYRAEVEAKVAASRF